MFWDLIGLSNFDLLDHNLTSEVKSKFTGQSRNVMRGHISNFAQICSLEMEVFKFIATLFKA